MPAGRRKVTVSVQFRLAPSQNLLQSCKSVSHHCIGRCTAAKWPRTTAKCIYGIAKRPRTITKRFSSIVSCPCSGAGRNCTAIPPALLVAMEFSCLVKLGRHTTPLPHSVPKAAEPVEATRSLLDGLAGHVSLRSQAEASHRR